MNQTPAFLFDLDGTLVDSVYEHVLAWSETLEQCGIELSVWRIHRRIGMSGGLFVNGLLRETGRDAGAADPARLQALHMRAYQRRAGQVRPLPGARELLAYLTEVGVPWAIATSGLRANAAPTIERLEVPPEVPVITRDQTAWPPWSQRGVRPPSGTTWCSSANATASSLEWTPSLTSTFWTCVRTVLSDR